MSLCVFSSSSVFQIDFENALVRLSLFLERLARAFLGRHRCIFGWHSERIDARCGSSHRVDVTVF